MKTVGILGGMGPAATVLLMQKIMAATAAQSDADHLPLLVDQNTQVPSRLRHLLEGDRHSNIPLIEQLESLSGNAS